MRQLEGEPGPYLGPRGFNERVSQLSWDSFA
jgi:hypothetical protein